MIPKPQSEHGYTTQEIFDIALHLRKTNPKFSEKTYLDALTGITGRLYMGMPYIYPSDVEYAVECGLKNTDISL